MLLSVSEFASQWKCMLNVSKQMKLTFSYVVLEENWYSSVVKANNVIAYDCNWNSIQCSANKQTKLLEFN